MAGAMERPAEDKLIQLHRKLDEISLAMFESLRQLPDEPRAGTEPHPAIVQSAATLVNKSREFDKIADEICTEWTMTAAEQINELAALRIENEHARQEVMDAAKRLSSALLAVKQVLDAMYEAQSKAIPHSAALENKAVRPLILALRARVAFLLETRQPDQPADSTRSV